MFFCASNKNKFPKKKTGKKAELNFGLDVPKI